MDILLIRLCQSPSNPEPTTPIHKKREILRRIVYSLVAFTKNNRITF